MDLNRVTLIGRLTRDPEVRSTPAGRSVAQSLLLLVELGQIKPDRNKRSQSSIIS